MPMLDFGVEVVEAKRWKCVPATFKLQSVQSVAAAFSNLPHTQGFNISIAAMFHRTLAFKSLQWTFCRGRHEARSTV